MSVNRTHFFFTSNTMEVKKSSRANLDKNTTTNFLMGLVIALGFLFIGFEYSNTEVTVQDISDSSGEIEEEMMIEITRQYVPPPPPPPQTVQTDLIQIVEDNTLEEEVEFESMEDIPDEAVVITSSGDITEEYDPNGEVFMFVEEMPGFPGGDRALMEFINKNLRYPQLALENGISGRVICTFVIDGRGKVSDIQVIRSVDPNLDREAIRVISMMPDWKPGKQRGKPVRVRYTLPIIFKLQ